MNTPTPSTLSHVGICVSDLDRSRRFYAEVLGFQIGACLTCGTECADLVDLQDELAFECQFMMKNGALFELIHYREPGHVGPNTARPHNQLGMTHLSFRVPDIDAVAQKIAEYGGAILETTRTDHDYGRIIFCTDPDGTKIELMQIPDALQFMEPSQARTE